MRVGPADSTTLSAVNSTRALESWLAERSLEQLSELLEQRDLPHADPYGAASHPNWRWLAGELLGDRSVNRALRELSQGDLQVLLAAVELALQLYGPVPSLSPLHLVGPSRHSPVSPAPAFDPASRAVPRKQLLDLLAPDDATRAAAEAALVRLAERALVLPPHGTKVVVPAVVHRELSALRGYGRPVDQLLTEAFKAAEIHRIAAELGLPKGRTRDVAQQRISALLGDPDQVRALAATAPSEARELLAKLTAGPPLLRTHCFVSEYGYYAPGAKFGFRAAGSGDQGTDWLAARGMVVPVGTDLAELPYEIGSALREQDARPEYQPVPPSVPTAVPLPSGAAGEAQAAAAAAASRVELLLRAVAAQPPALRKAGGIAVRDTRRLAKAIGVPEDQARLWLDLAANADLLAAHREEAPPSRGRGRSRAPEPAPSARILPTERYDGWLASAPAQRLLPLVTTWACVPELFTWWPDPDETPVALVAPQDAQAVPLRLAVLDALSALPEGYGIDPGNPAALADLLWSAAWFRPGIGLPDDELVERARAVLYEAGLLGVVAHGALTPVGHAVRSLLHGGAARHFPAVPGAGPALARHRQLSTAVVEVGEALAGLLPAAQTTARFQADLTAVVAGAASPELTELLSAVADRESEGHAIVWRITAATVRRALDHGLDAAELLEHLTEASEGGRPLPQPLEYLIKDTARTHGRMRVVRSACCIRSDDEALVLELSKARTLARLGLRRIAPTVLISTAAPADTLAALRAAGYAPVLEAETGTTVVERIPEQRAPSTMPSLSKARPHYGRGPRTAHDLAAALLGTTE